MFPLVLLFVYVTYCLIPKRYDVENLQTDTIALSFPLLIRSNYRLDERIR